MNSLEELGYAGLLPLNLIMVVVEQYDRTVARLVSQAADIYTVRGDLAAFRSEFSFLGHITLNGIYSRIVKDLHWVVLYDATIYKEENSEPKGRKKTRRYGTKLCKLPELELLCRQAVVDCKSKRVVQEKKRNSRSTVQDRKKLSNGVRADFLRPMPYNEKLRRGGRENSQAIAETQVSAREVLRGRYRKAATEYPLRSGRTYRIFWCWTIYSKLIFSFRIEYY